ncbi:DUF4442 domain-containing protein [Pseudobacteriovorax antillogorgiicola]|uniref:Acyl-coenzyme A thioesterase PaaI, contains HGG motif n=1 Tax=Pseudobacteriovorax antillogorgiicola TaxID=1513793 RepID=A0A1Y6CLZ5_9BACT|nr:DUF4442 domain-containing protein [Pseudobacteriovorax antillogorgiicola]TCS44996.1 uncharacterized protein DUF4442 [Pseudobacteriovorax antillogorgiicola]SMF76570.1 protein of unknown function [Pseudobacteriovorax antillogorgiicola]
MKSLRKQYEALMSHPRTFKTLLSLWPPFLFSGIRVAEVERDYRYIRIELKSYPFNRNHFGVHFGGSLFAMLDPFYMFMVLHNLGPKYYVWDKSGEIEFVKPGRGTVTAHLQVDQGMIDLIKSETGAGDKYLPEFSCEVWDEQDEVVAIYKKVLYVRLKPEHRS